MIGLPSGLERVRWKLSATSPQPAMTPMNFGAAGFGVFKAFEHQRAGAFGHDEAVAVFRERLRRLFRRIVLGRKCREQREADQGFGMHRAVGRNCKRGIAFTAADRFQRQLDRRAARGTRGRERNRQTLGAERIGEMIGNGAEQKKLVPFRMAATRR